MSLILEKPPLSSPSWVIPLRTSAKGQHWKVHPSLTSWLNYCTHSSEKSRRCASRSPLPSHTGLITWMHVSMCVCVTETEARTPCIFVNSIFFLQARIQSSNERTERRIFPSSQYTMSACVWNSLSDPIEHFHHGDGMIMLLIFSVCSHS